MENDTKIAIINNSSPEAANAVSKLSVDEQSDILTNGGKVTLIKGKSPNGLNCTLVAKISKDLTSSVVAIADDGREQPVAAANVAKVIAMLVGGRN